MQSNAHAPDLSSDNTEQDVPKIIEIDDNGDPVIHVFEPESQSATHDHIPVILDENGIPIPFPLYEEEYNTNPFIMPQTQEFPTPRNNPFDNGPFQFNNAPYNDPFPFNNDPYNAPYNFTYIPVSEPPPRKKEDQNYFTNAKSHFFGNRTGFFTPFTRGIGDFVGSLLAPIAFPLFLGALSFFVGILTVVCAAACLVCLLLALAAKVAGEKELGHTLLIFSAFAFLGTILAPLASMVLACLAIISFPIKTIQIATRSAATVGWVIGKVFGIEDCCEDNIELDNDEKLHDPFVRRESFGG